MAKDGFRQSNHKYAVKGEFKTYDGINLMKHALHNTIPDITKSKTVVDYNGNETEIKVRDGAAIQLAKQRLKKFGTGLQIGYSRSRMDSRTSWQKNTTGCLTVLYVLIMMEVIRSFRSLI